MNILDFVSFVSVIVFNLGEYRRQATRAYRNHEFFRLDNQEALAIRNKCAQDALEDVIRWIEAGGEVAVSIHQACS
jgi:6-phosphofructo-2-kinase/fructose-2,6-biphosphatase 2